METVGRAWQPRAGTTRRRGEEDDILNASAVEKGVGGECEDGGAETMCVSMMARVRASPERRPSEELELHCGIARARRRRMGKEVGAQLSSGRRGRAGVLVRDG